MDLLYRMHLVDFDPSKEEDIVKNWDWILEALSYSSETLYAKIGKTPYPSLTQNTKDKIHKYLLRGRYRSTPFGLWAGTGLAVWGGQNSSVIGLNYHEIKSPANLPINEAAKPKRGFFRLAPGTEQFEHHVNYWNYSAEEGGWRLGHLERNRIIDLLLKKLKTTSKLSLEEFRAFFQNRNAEGISGIWQMILDSGLLIPAEFPWKDNLNIRHGANKDVKLSCQITLDNQLKLQLEALTNEMGALFVPIESGYLKGLKRWLLKNFDDRFVPLDMIPDQFDFYGLSSNPDSEEHGEIKGISGAKFWNDTMELDLSLQFEKQAITLPNHLQFVFKVGQSHQIYVENIVCNRPFAYAGRFSLDSGIAKVVKSTLTGQMDDSEYIHADLFLFESTKANYISRHSNAFAHTVYPFGSSPNRHIIGTDELEIGIHHDRICLYCKRLKKAVIPVVQHPLNPSQISHPLSRLLWEIGNQDQVKFLPYYHPAFQDSAYVPRLKWGNVILQGRSWKLNFEKFKDENALSGYLAHSGVPDRILAGYLDRELLLEWTDPRDFGLLWAELKVHGELQVFECLWAEDTAFSSQKGSALYPQFVHAWKLETSKPAAPLYINRINCPNQNWVYARIFVRPEGFQPFFSKSFPLLVASILKDFTIKKWHYLVYNSPELEIRLRFEMEAASEIQKATIASRIKEFNGRSGWVQETIFAPYYPETEKYGKRGIATSEYIFYWESQFALFGKGDQSQALVNMQEAQRLNELSLLFEALIQKTGNAREVFEYFKSRAKKASPEIKKCISNYDRQPTSEQPPNWRGEYMELHLRQECFKGKRRLFILSQHLHMFCNRAFPNNPLEFEEKLVCLLYKRTGYSVYASNPSPNPANLKKVLAK